MSDKEYDPYDEKLYWNKCNRGYLLNPDTRWCCRECWIDQRVNYKRPTLEEFINEFLNEEHNYTFKTEYTPISDDWKVLQLEPPKTQTEIKKQYRKLALLYHPDKPTGTHNLFTQLNSSYNTLIETY
tara:strand:- start:192 stop:572 length:381 start_codon:yes stop_codon:yes gene_type:complete